jgi:ssDNA thymidine ADP-ribosyltransferase, DarT
MAIQETAAKREIQYLLHFTRLENLQSILVNGLLPTNACAAQGVKPIVNDTYRWDYTDAICFSVSFPNYKMFYARREEVKKTEPDAQWTVIAVNPSVMWDKNSAFCRENAANTNVTNIPLAQRKSEAAFDTMFSDYNDKTRELLKIPDSYTTHPQAEVLIFEPVEARYIIGAAFETVALKDAWSTKGAGKQFVHFPSFFRGRLDYAHWKKVT